MDDSRHDIDRLAAIVSAPTARSVATLDGADIDRLTDAAIDHRVAGSLAIALRDAGTELPEPLVVANQLATVDHLRTRAAIRRIAEALDGRGIRWAIIKGPMMAMRWPHGATERPYDDLDLLVSPSDLPESIETLEGIGFHHRSSNWSGFRSLEVGEVPLSDGSVIVDLHWHLVGLGDDRRDLRIPTDELLDRSVPVDLDGCTVRTLCDVDTLMHLCVHDALAGAQSVSHLRDVHLVARTLSTGEIRDRLRATRTARLAAVVLDRSDRMFAGDGNRPIAMEATGARRWIRLNRAVDAAWAASPASTWTPYPGALAGAGRQTAVGTARAAGRGLVEFVQARTGRPTIVSPGGPLDWAVDAGGDAGRQRYLDDVTSGRFRG